MLKRKSGNECFAEKKLKSIKRTKGYLQKTLPFSVGKAEGNQIFSLHSEVYGVLVSYLKDYKARNETHSSGGRVEKSILIQGPAGSGKTFLIRQIASDLNLDLLEINFSLNKPRSTILKMLEESSNSFSIDQNGKSGTLIFIDDIDLTYQYEESLFIGILSLLKSSKSPIILTCTQTPQIFHTFEHIKQYKLSSYLEKSILILQKFCESKQISVSDCILKNVFLKCNSNLNKVFSCLAFNSSELFYSPVYRIESEKTENCKIGQKSEEMSVLCELLQNLVQVDLLQRFNDDVQGGYRLAGYFEGLAKWCDGEDGEEVKGKTGKDYGRIVREQFWYAEGLEDYVSFVQVLDELPSSLHPLSRSWQKRMNYSYLDVFLIV